MNITQTFYDNLATKYDSLFEDWQSTTKEQGLLLHKLFSDNGYDKSAPVLDCACGIGTQAIGLASQGYSVTASDISKAELAEAKKRAEQNGVDINFKYGDFCRLADTFDSKFDIIIAMDNALPHMLTSRDLASAISSIIGQLAEGGMFVASIRDYDNILESKPPYSPPYIHKTGHGQRVAFQTWVWKGDNYRLTQYIIEDEGALQVSKFECEYRAVKRQELSDLLYAKGCKEVKWLMPCDSGFYQPIVIAKK